MNKKGKLYNFKHAMNQVKNSIKQKMDLSFSTLPKDSDIVMIMKEQRIKKIGRVYFHCLTSHRV